LEKFIKISVYDVAPKVLSMFDESLANYAMEVFKREGVELKTSHHVEELRPGLPAQDVGIMNVPDTEGCYTLKTKEEGEVGVAMCVWSTGNMMNPFVQNAVKKCHAYPGVCYDDRRKIHGGARRGGMDDQEKRETGAIVVDDHLRIQLETRHAEGEQPSKGGNERCFALGDNAALENIVLPATAQTANQQALWLGKHLNKGDIDTQTFSFKNMGMMTYLGNAKIGADAWGSHQRG
jgi:NADH dehydrogenase